VIVVSILAQDLAVLRARALAQVPFADAIELRLDALAHITESDLRELVTSIAKPVIVAVNGPDAFGTFTGTREERCALLARAARAGVALIDVDWREAPHQPALPSPCRRIVSRHLVDDTPHDLAAPFQELVAAAHSSDLVKFVTHAHNGEDGVRLLEFAHSIDRDFIAFASGERGSFTRILAPIFGSAFTYAAPARVAGVDVGAATAPGQSRVDEVRSHWDSQPPTRATEIFAVLGLPARHSLSPRLHNAVFRAHDRDAVYVAIEPDDITAFMSLLESPNWRGFSVTAPFKEAAFALAALPDEPREQTGATNTLIRSGHHWLARNTDFEAISSVLSNAAAHTSSQLAELRALVVGSGGAARSAIWALRANGVHDLTVTARNDKKAETLAQETLIRSLSRASLRNEHFDVIVHCTPAGSRAAPNEIAVPLECLRTARIVVEAVYRPEITPLVEAARAAGAHVVLGRDWFFEQAAPQAVCFGSDALSARKVMRSELDHALSEDGS